MNKNVVTTPRNSSQQLNTSNKQFIVLLHVLTVLSCLMTMSLTGEAQAPYYEPSAKVYTPLTEQPGAPAGSYPLSGFDNVNLFNGHLSFSLPLMQIGGRGKAGYTIMLPIEQHWQVQTVAVPTCDFSGCSYPESNYRYIANPIWWDGIRPGFRHSRSQLFSSKLEPDGSHTESSFADFNLRCEWRRTGTIKF